MSNRDSKQWARLTVLAATCCILVPELLGNHNEPIVSGQSINRPIAGVKLQLQPFHPWLTGHREFLFAPVTVKKT